MCSRLWTTSPPASRPSSSTAAATTSPPGNGRSHPHWSGSAAGSTRGETARDRPVLLDEGVGHDDHESEQRVHHADPQGGSPGAAGGAGREQAPGEQQDHVHGEDTRIRCPPRATIPTPRRAAGAASVPSPSPAAPRSPSVPCAALPRGPMCCSGGVRGGAGELHGGRPVGAGGDGGGRPVHQRDAGMSRAWRDGPRTIRTSAAALGLGTGPRTDPRVRARRAPSAEPRPPACRPAGAHPPNGWSRPAGRPLSVGDHVSAYPARRTVDVRRTPYERAEHRGGWVAEQRDTATAQTRV